MFDVSSTIVSGAGADRASPARFSAPSRIRDAVLRLRGDARGAAAVEFALVGSMLVLVIVFVMMIGFLLYIGQALDRATDLASRQIMIGAVQKAGLSQSAFRSSVLCPALPSGISCNDVIVNVQTVTEAAQPTGYYALVNAGQTGLIIPSLSNTGAQFNPGAQGSYVYVQVIYPITILPAFMTSLLGAGATYNGAPAYLAVSTAAFRNEQY